MQEIACPSCGAKMQPVYVVIGGGVWLSGCREQIADRIGLLTALPESAHVDEVHCVVGNSGYRRGDWPKEGLYCQHCSSFLVKPMKTA